MFLVRLFNPNHEQLLFTEMSYRDHVHVIDLDHVIEAWTNWLPFRWQQFPNAFLSTKSTCIVFSFKFHWFVLKDLIDSYSILVQVMARFCQGPMATMVTYSTLILNLIVIIALDNGFLPEWHQAIIWRNAALPSTTHWETNSSEFATECNICSFRKRLSILFINGNQAAPRRMGHP